MPMVVRPCLLYTSAEGYRPRVSEIENNYYFDSRAVGELQQMLADGRKEGLDFWICSAYRTMEKQTDLYNNKVSRLQAEGLSYEDAYRQAGTVVAYPGTCLLYTSFAIAP